MERLSEPSGTLMKIFKVDCNTRYAHAAGYLAIVLSVALYISAVTDDSDILDNLRQPFSSSPTSPSSYVSHPPQDWSQESHLFQSDEVDALLDAIRESTWLAADGSNYDLTREEINEWRHQNPCESRSALPAIYEVRKRVRKLSPNPYWDQVLDEYSKLHRTCMRRVGNVTEYFLHGQNSNYSIPGCKFLVGEGMNGLGNKLLVTVSALLYAIVSQRVLLVPGSTNIGHFFCEPFVGSSWLFDAASLNFPLPTRDALNKTWTKDSEFLVDIDRVLKDPKENLGSVFRSNLPESYEHLPRLPKLAQSLVVASGWTNWQPKDWFYCKTEQVFLSQVPWVYFSGCIYTIPKLFGSPAFRSTLEALFPDRMVLTRILRSVGLPSDYAWGRFKHLNHAHFQRADRRVGIQVRFFRSGDHEAKGKLVSDRVLDCVVKNGLLPNVSYESWHEVVDKTNGTTPPVTKVFIASLYMDLYEHLTDFYLRSPAVTGEDVGLVQITNHKDQRTGVEEDTEALVEVLLLSVSDDLLITPLSTFGGLSQAYGGLTPWFIRYFDKDPKAESCERAQTTDTCQQGARPDYSCGNDPPPEVGSSKYRPVQRCLQIDCPNGVQVISAPH